MLLFCHLAPPGQHGWQQMNAGWTSQLRTRVFTSPEMNLKRPEAVQRCNERRVAASSRGDGAPGAADSWSVWYSFSGYTPLDLSRREMSGHFETAEALRTSEGEPPSSEFDDIPGNRQAETMAWDGLIDAPSSAPERFEIVI
jgi:hypothetical protein